MAHQEGLSLVIVPCWWNGSLERYFIILFFSSLSFCFFSLLLSSSHMFYIVNLFLYTYRLVSTISFQRPDIEIHSERRDSPISLNPPLKFFTGILFLSFLSFLSFSFSFFFFLFSFLHSSFILLILFFFLFSFLVPTIPQVGELMLASFPHSNFIIPDNSGFKW